MSEERIRARIAELRAERNALVVRVNQQIAALNGAIQALEGLLVPEEADAPPSA